MKLNFMRTFLLLFTFFIIGCSPKDLKRQVYFNFKMGSTLSEFENDVTEFYRKNNNKMYAAHSYNNSFYYSSLDARHNKYDTVINFLTIFFFLNPEEYKGQFDAHQSNSTLFLDAESKKEIEDISSDILNDLKNKYGEPNDTTEYGDFEVKEELTKKFIWTNKNDLKINFIKNTMFYENYETPTDSKYFYSLRIIYEYTDNIKNKYFKEKSPY